MPIADENQHKQKNGDHQQPSSLGRIHCMPVLLLGIIVRRGGRHANIVAPRPELFLSEPSCPWWLWFVPESAKSAFIRGKEVPFRMLN